MLSATYQCSYGWDKTWKKMNLMTEISMCLQVVWSEYLLYTWTNNLDKQTAKAPIIPWECTSFSETSLGTHVWRYTFGVEGAGSNPQLPDHQLDAQPPRPAIPYHTYSKIWRWWWFCFTFFVPVSWRKDDNGRLCTMKYNTVMKWIPPWRDLNPGHGNSMLGTLTTQTSLKFELVYLTTWQCV